MKRIKEVMNMFLLYFTAFLLIIMTSLVVWQVFTRYILSNPSVFTEELVRIILVWSSFLGAAYAFGTRQHMALVFLKEKLKGNSQRAICVFIDIMILVFATVVLIKGGYKLVLGVEGVKTPILGISKQTVYMIAPISGILITIYQLVNIKEDLEITDEL